MAGPKMGPRPADFDEQLIRQSPTFLKWQGLAKGEKLRYACRDFIKGHDSGVEVGVASNGNSNDEEEERLMRRIMIARRNNVKDHQALKRARYMTSNNTSNSINYAKPTSSPPSTNVPSKAAKAESNRKRRPPTVFSDSEIIKEMDVAAVEATRSYRKWKSLKDGELLTYNQIYIKGQAKHEWLLKKNIWRRMRYRRENKKIVEKLKLEDHDYLEDATTGETSATTRNRSTRAAVASAAAVAAVAMMDSDSVMDASTNVVHNPLDAVADSAALDAAARLADAATVDEAAVAAATAAVSQGSVEV